MQQYYNFVVIITSSGDCLVLDHNKPLIEWMLCYHQFASQAFPSEQFNNMICSIIQSIKTSKKIALSRANVLSSIQLVHYMDFRSRLERMHQCKRASGAWMLSRQGVAPLASHGWNVQYSVRSWMSYVCVSSALTCPSLIVRRKYI